MRKHKLAFIDTETTGFLPDKHELIEIGGIIVEQDWENEKPSFKIVDEFEIKIKPKHIESADPVSLRVNKYDIADWVFAYSLSEGLNLFNQKTKDCIMVAHNLCFDYSFLEKAFVETGIENQMHYLKIDTITLAFAKLHNNKDINKYSLRFLCEYFKIENKNSHTALSDARALFELYQKLITYGEVIEPPVVS